MNNQIIRQLHTAISPIHGTGVFASEPIQAGDLIGFYVGEIITPEEKYRREVDNNIGSPATCYFFQLDENRIIDGYYGGNILKHANHSCEVS